MKLTIYLSLGSGCLWSIVSVLGTLLVNTFKVWLTFGLLIHIIGSGVITWSPLGTHVVLLILLIRGLGSHDFLMMSAAPMSMSTRFGLGIPFALS